MSSVPDFTVVGAGLAGSLMAIYLAQQGHEVHVYERRGDLRRAPVPRGRSINLALSTRGLSALHEVGMRPAILEQAIPMRGRMIHGLDGSPVLQPYSIHPHERIYSVSRHGLNTALLDRAESLPRVRLFFHHRCTGWDPASATLHFTDESRQEPLEAAARSIVGADGVHSAVRGQMEKLDRFDYSQNFLEWGYKELTMPSRPGGGFAMDPHALHIWPRHNFMLIALPNVEGSFTCTLFLPFEGPRSFQAIQDPASATIFFAEHFPDALPLMPTLEEDFAHNPTSSLAYINCYPWNVGDRVVLIGDACHAVVPFYGQGMNAAFEDCSVLSSCLHRASSRRDAFAAYGRLRKPHADALAELSLQNFVEMRDRVTSPTFILKKNAERVLHRLFPSGFIPLYSMVTFSRIPYAEAVARARRQDRLLLALGLGTAAGAAGLAASALARWLGRDKKP